MYLYKPFPEERVRVTVFHYVGSVPDIGSSFAGSLSGSISASRRAWIRDGGVALVVSPDTTFAEFCKQVTSALRLPDVAAVFTEQGEPVVADAFELFSNQVLFVVSEGEEMPELDTAADGDALDVTDDTPFHAADHFENASTRDARFTSSRDTFRSSFTGQYDFGDVAELQTIELYTQEQEDEIAALQKALPGDVLVGDSCPKRVLVYVRHADVPKLHLSLSVVFPPAYPTAAPIVHAHVGNAALLLDCPIRLQSLSAKIDKAMARSTAIDGRIFELYTVARWHLHSIASAEQLAELHKKLDRADPRRSALSMRHVFANWNYSAVSTQSLMVLRARGAAKVSDALDIRPLQAEALLQKMDWKVSDIMRAVRKLGKEKAVKKLEIPPLADQSWYSSCSLADEQECTICFDSVPLEELTALHCGHWFDNECYGGYLGVQIQDGATDRITCPHKDCDVPVDAATVASLVSEEVFAKYMRFQLDNFVKTHPQLRWCPNVRCDLAIESSTISRTPGYFVMCTCGTRTCFRCNDAPHWPAPCQTMAWNRNEFNEEAEEGGVDLFTRWLQGNAKQCPQCHVNIEKNMGCNHMHCRMCNYDFCWVCLSKFTGAHYSCTRPKANAQKGRSHGTKMGGIVFDFKYDLSLPFTFFLQSIRRVRVALSLRYRSFYNTGALPSHLQNEKICDVARSVLEHAMLVCRVGQAVCYLGRHVKHLKLRGCKRLKLPLMKLTEFAWVFLDLLHSERSIAAFASTGKSYISASVQVLRDLGVEVKHMSPHWGPIWNPMEHEKQMEDLSKSRVEERAVRISVNHLEQPALPTLPGFMHNDKESLLRWAASKWGISDVPTHIFLKSGAEVTNTDHVMHGDDLYLSSSNIFMFPEEVYEVAQSATAEMQGDSPGSSSDDGSEAADEREGAAESRRVLGLSMKKFLRHEQDISSLARLFPAHPLRLLCSVLASCRFDVERAIESVVMHHAEAVDEELRSVEDQELMAASFTAHEHKALVLMSMFPGLGSEEAVRALQRCAFDEARAAALIAESTPTGGSDDCAACPSTASATSSAGDAAPSMAISAAAVDASPTHMSASDAPAVVQTLNLRYAAKVQQVQSHVPAASFEQAREMLQKCGGDIELAVVQLLDALAPEEDAVCERQFLTSSVLDEDVFSDFDDQEDDGAYISENEWY